MSSAPLQGPLQLILPKELKLYCTVLFKHIKVLLVNNSNNPVIVGRIIQLQDGERYILVNHLAAVQHYIDRSWKPLFEEKQYSVKLDREVKL